MNIPQRIWDEYIARLSMVDKTASNKVRAYLNRYGIPDNYEASQRLIEYANSLVMKYGEASAALSAEMYDAISMAEKANVQPAIPADIPEYGLVAKTINGTIKLVNIEIIAGAVERLVKMPSADTMIKNAIRDHAEWAWIPRGDTCAFCITLGSRGWQKATKEQLDGGHAEHIHANCDCTFAIRHKSDTNVEGYDPDKYLEMYDNADTSSAGYDPNRPKGQQYQSISKAKVNGLRREFYTKNKEKINAQKRAAYQKRKELESSKAEEINVGG